LVSALIDKSYHPGGGNRVRISGQSNAIPVSMLVTKMEGSHVEDSSGGAKLDWCLNIPWDWKCGAL